MGEETLQIVPGIGSDLEYYGRDDARWSQAKQLVYDEGFKRVDLLNDPTLRSALNRPATLEEIRAQFPTKDFQRILLQVEVPLRPTYWVVSALFRRPDGADIRAKEPLHELPPTVSITTEEMETLGPWLGLGLDADGKTSVILERANPLDNTLADGTDVIFATRYNWKDPDSIAELLDALVNFQLVRLGAMSNPKNWPTDFDEERLAQLITLVEKQCLKLNPGIWEKIKEHAFYLLVGIPSTLFVAGAFHGAMSPSRDAFGYGISALLSPAKWSYKMAQRVVAYLGPKLAPSVAQTVNVSKGLVGLGAGGAARFMGPLAALSLGDMVGGLAVSAYMQASGTADDPDYRLMRFAYDQMVSEFAGRPLGFLFGNVIQGMQGAAALVSDSFENNLFEGIDDKVNSYIYSSNRFGDDIVKQLLTFVLESRDSRGQIDSRVFRQKVLALYQVQQQKVQEAYELLQLTGHRALRGQRIRELISEDGTVRDFGLLKKHLQTQQKILLPLLQGGGVSAAAPMLELDIPPLLLRPQGMARLAPVKHLKAPEVLVTGGALLHDIALLDDDPPIRQTQRTANPRAPTRTQRFRGPIMSTRSTVPVRAGSLARVVR